MNHFKNQRTILLIDSENLEIEAKNHYGAKMDYKKIIQTIGTEHLVRAICFKPLDKLPKSQEQKLISLGYELKTTPKNVDCWLTISAVTLADKCDVVILIGGDADYLPVTYFLNSRGVKTIIWSWPNCTSQELKALADEYWPMTTEYLLNKQNNIIPLTANGR